MFRRNLLARLQSLRPDSDGPVTATPVEIVANSNALQRQESLPDSNPLAALGGIEEKKF